MNRTKLFGFIVGAVVLSGCGGGEAEHAEAAKTPVTPVSNTDTDNPPVESGGHEVAETQTAEVFELDPAAPPLDEDFKNPFFAPQPEEIKVVEDSRDEATGGSGVVLLGFINVTEPKAIIQIDETVYTAVEGTTYDRVTVVKIDDESVTLRRKNEEWQIALFDRPDAKALANSLPAADNRSPFNSRNSQNPGTPPTPGGGGLPNIPGLPGSGGTSGGFPSLPGLGDIPGAVQGFFGN